MSFMGGAECSTGHNPLAQMTKFTSEDKSLQRDRLAGPRPAGPEGLRTIGGDMAAADKQMMDEFYAQQPGPVPSPFAFDSMRHELAEMQRGPPMVSQASAAQPWASEFHTHGPNTMAPMSPEERSRLDAAFKSGNPNETWARATLGHITPEGNIEKGMEESWVRVHTTNLDERMNSPGPMNQSTAQYYRQFQGYQFNGGLPFTAASQSYMMGPNMAQQNGLQKGKGKQVTELSDDNWEAQFKEYENMQTAELDLDAEANKAIDDELNSQETMFGDFQSVWDGIQREREENAPYSDIDWANEIDSSIPWSPENSHTTTMPRLGEYLFEPDNPFVKHSDPFAEGKRLVETGGNLSLAALAFEAAVQQKAEHVEAWTELGGCQAMNEKETPAIRAYEAALKLDENNLSALMGLAVSYTNEGYDTTAYATLERWLSTKYPQISASAGPAPNSTLDRQNIHDRVTNLFINAAQLSPEGAAMDADVQVGLGVLFYGAEEYDKAVDCFSAALNSASTSTSPEHLLWNRLGATLANSGRSEEAINAYERALTINPNFVRARYNLGVSCINIGCFHQAAEHLLGALAMHRVAEEKARQDAGDVGLDPTRIVQNQSTNLFDTLRRVFGQMNRRDLADLVVNGMDLNVFRGEFEF